MKRGDERYTDGIAPKNARLVKAVSSTRSDLICFQLGSSTGPGRSPFEERTRPYRCWASEVRRSLSRRGETRSSRTPVFQSEREIQTKVRDGIVKKVE